MEGMFQKVDLKLGEMTRAMESLDQASRRSGADIGVQMQKALDDVAELRGQVDTYLFRIGELEAQLKKANEDSERRFAELMGSDAVKEREARRQAQEIQRPTDKKDFLALADGKAKQKEFQVARQLYSEFLQKWPKDELAGEAHFGAGETYVEQDRCQEALYEFRKVIQDHPKARSVPVAYLHSASCFRKLKLSKEAKAAVGELLRAFPKSDAARQGKVLLAEIEREEKPPAPAPKKGKK